MSLSPVTFPCLLLMFFSSAVISNPQDGVLEKTRKGMAVDEVTTFNQETQLLKEEDDREKRAGEAITVEALATQLAQQAEELTFLKAQIKADENKQSQGSTFVRWGRSVCPSGAELVYSGVVGGSRTDSSGASQNRLCLTLHPQLVSMPIPDGHAALYGAEYWDIEGHHTHDALCAVCEAHHSMTIMMPATKACPKGWTTQYTGYLSGGDYADPSGVDFVCLDDAPEDRDASFGHEVSSYFVYTQAVCGSLPCPPYENHKIVTCAVCSK